MQLITAVLYYTDLRPKLYKTETRKTMQKHNRSKKKTVSQNLASKSIKPNVKKYINESNVLIHSSKFEGLPNILIEAQLQKKLIMCIPRGFGNHKIAVLGRDALQEFH